MDKFKEKLRDMLKDERKAPIDYSKLKKLAHTKGEKKIFSGIIKDEKSHYKKLNEMSKRCHKH
jgi:rubrerythrin